MPTSGQLPDGFELEGVSSAAPMAGLPQGFELEDAPTYGPGQLPSQSPELADTRAQLQRFGVEGDSKIYSLLDRIDKIGRPIVRGITETAEGALSLPKLLVDLPANFSNTVFGTEIPTFSSQPSLTDIAGVAPKNDSEKLSSSIARGVGGTTSLIGAGRSLATSAPGIVRRVGESLAANPALQTAGAVTAATSSEVARQSGAGPVGQLVAGLAGSLAPSVAASGVSKLASGLSRTQEAQRLLDRGVDLTPGQLNPKGRINQIEEGTQSVGFVGTGITAGRENARSTFERAAIEVGSAPGTKITQASPAQMLKQAYDSFTPLYDKAKGFGATAEIVKTTGNVPLVTAFRRAVGNRGVIATNDERKAVMGFLKSQLTKGVSSSDHLIDMRSVVRAESRKAIKSGNSERAELLDAADDQITKALESQLSGSSAGNKALKALQTADKHYGDYKIAERAVARSKDRPGGFTPNDLSESVAAANQGAAQGSYARGAGGAMRQLAADARAVLDSRSPPTGARMLALAPGAAAATIDPVTGLVVQGATTAGVVAGAATKTGRQLAQGSTKAQKALKPVVSSALANTDLPLSYKQAPVNTILREAQEKKSRNSLRKLAPNKGRE